MEKEIVNKVAGSKLVTLDLEDLYPEGERILFDIKDLLFQGLILKEKDFRDFVKATDWSTYKEKHVAIHCSADAIVPTWAFMLLSITLQPFAKTVIFGTLDDLEKHLFNEELSKIDWSRYTGAKVVIKGCSKVKVPEMAYVNAASLLRPYASSIMYGEPCSTVPLFKNKPN